MLSPSLRLLVRHQARSAPLQVRRQLNSTGPRPIGFADFKEWVQQLHRVRRGKQSHSPSGSAQGGGSLKKRKKNTTGPKSSRTAHKKPRKAMTREQRILKTVLNTVRDKQRPNPTTYGAGSWPVENWSTDGWGLDSKSRVKPWHH